MSFTKRVTGPGVTERVNMVSADLGAVAYDPKRRAYAYVFGDNFAERYLRGEWQSPSILMYDKDHNLLGIPTGTTQILESGNRRQALDYNHNAGGISTILPCDIMLLRGRWIMSAMIVGMGGLGDEKATQFFESPDLVKWTKFGPSLEHPGHPGNVMLTHDRQGSWVYIFGTGGLARNRPIWLWRCAADTFPEGWWEPWGAERGVWNWGNANENSPVMPGRYGELSFRFIQGQSVLSFFDVNEYSCSALTQQTPTDDWTLANRVDYARGPEVFQLYGGYICPDSRLNEPNGMKFTVSQWNTGNNDPYHVIAFADTLHAKGPLVDAKPEPEPEQPDDTADLAYGLPTGTNTGGYGSGGKGIFPQWVQEVGQRFGVAPSTYAGHQETDRNEAGYAPNPHHENRGIDWSGDPAQMRAMAEYLMQHPELVEQLIYQDPETGKTYEISGGKVSPGYYGADTLAGHRDHVHTRQSRSFTAGSLPRPPTTEGDMGPQELYELLLRELSASGSEPIVTPDGEKLTLRQAIEQIYWKERGDHGLEGGRPRHPNKSDDQLGHVLNARAEGLFTQTLIVALAEKAGIDVGAIYQQVQESFPK